MPGCFLARYKVHMEKIRYCMNTEHLFESIKFACKLTSKLLSLKFCV